MTLKLQSAICWLVTASVAVLGGSAVMATSPTRFHRMGIAVTVALMVLMNGWMWSRLQRKAEGDLAA